MRVKNNLPSAFSNAIGRNSAGLSSSSDFANSTMTARCHNWGITFSDHTRFIMTCRALSILGHFLYTRKRIPLMPGAFLFLFLLTALSRSLSFSSEVSNLTCGNVGRTQPGGAWYFVVRAKSLYVDMKCFSASSTLNEGLPQFRGLNTSTPYFQGSCRNLRC